MARRIYSDVFMADAVQMVMDDGVAINRVADELGIPHGTLWNWVQRAQPDGRTAPSHRPVRTDEQDEIRALRQRIAELEQENAFLGKASAYFASKRRP